MSVWDEKEFETISSRGHQKLAARSVVHPSVPFLCSMLCAPPFFSSFRWTNGEPGSYKTSAAVLDLRSPAHTPNLRWNNYGCDGNATIPSCLDRPYVESIGCIGHLSSLL